LENVVTSVNAKLTGPAFKPSLAGEGWVRRNKIILFCKMLFSLFLKVKRIGKKEFILTSPHPTLSSRRGLQRCVYCFYAK